jgi:hypothetical protein
MPDTPNLALPYPQQTDTADVPRDIQALAVKLDGFPLLRPPVVTALPASPVDGDEVYFQLPGDPSYKWHLRYDAASANAQKWEYLGGSAFTAGPSGSIVTNATVRTPMTNGPTITVPLTGAYYVVWGLSVSQGAAAVLAMNCTPGRGTTSLPGLTAISFLGMQQYDGGRLYAEQDEMALSKGDVVQLLVWANSAVNVTYSGGYLSLLPVRVG